MPKKYLQYLFNRYWILSQKHNLAGFTLIELLVSMLIGSIAISVLLTLVVQLLQTDQQESVRSETQREMQMALDYISQDLRESVYIYAGDCIQGRTDNAATSENEYCPGIVNHVTVPANSVPVLAFWKLEPLPDECQQAANQTDALCKPFLLSGRTYSLVVYFLRKNQSGEEWQGKARITRYVLDQFSKTASGSLVKTTGYVNPLTTGISFRSWPRQSQAGGTYLNLQASLPASNSVVLVDFVDATGGSSDPCDPTDPLYIASPNSTTLGTSFAGVRSFYACVRVANPVNQQIGVNQDAVVFLKGNTSGRRGSGGDFLPILQTQVFAQGIVNKEPSAPQ